MPTDQIKPDFFLSRFEFFGPLGNRFRAVFWLTVSLFVLSGFAARAQSTWEVGGGLGGLVYKGDLAPSLIPANIRPAGNLLVRYNVSQPFTVRFNAGIGQIAGDDKRFNDAFQQARGLAFKTNIREMNVLMEYNFLNYSSLRKVKNWTPYVFGGLGLFTFKTNPSNPGYQRKSLFNFPLGVGVKYEFKRPWSLGLEYGTRFSGSDYLDNFGPNTFGSTNKLLNGNPDSKDSYTYIGLMLTYRFYRITCPE
ncbi:type IX secretion system protein PorG [Larkinella ripae]